MFSVAREIFPTCTPISEKKQWNKPLRMHLISSGIELGGNYGKKRTFSLWDECWKAICKFHGQLLRRRPSGVYRGRIVPRYDVPLKPQFPFLLSETNVLNPESYRWSRYIQLSKYKVSFSRIAGWRWFHWKLCSESARYATWDPFMQLSSLSVFMLLLVWALSAMRSYSLRKTGKQDFLHLSWNSPPTQNSQDYARFV